MANLKTKKKAIIKEEDDVATDTITSGILSPEQKAAMRNMLYSTKEDLLKIEKYAGVELGSDGLVQKVTDIDARVSSILTDLQIGSVSEGMDEDSRIDLDSPNDSGQHVIESKQSSKKKTSLNEINIHKEWVNLFENTNDDVIADKPLSTLCEKLEKYSNIIAKKLGRNKGLDYDEIIQQISLVESVDEFENNWNKLYDFADKNNIIIKS